MRFLFVDKIVSIETGKTVRGIKHITADDYYLTLDESKQVVFMPSLIGETLGQLAAWHVMDLFDFKLRPVAGVVSSATSHQSAPLGSTLLLESTLESYDHSAVQYHSHAYIDDQLIFSIDGALGPMLPMPEFIDEDLVRQQYAQIAPSDEDHPQSTLAKLPMDVYPDIQQTGNPIIFNHDRVVSFQPKQSIDAIKAINLSAAYLADHFPRKPVLPLTVLLECHINLARTFIQHSQFELSYRFEQMRKIKMSAFVRPGDVIHTSVKVKSCDDQIMVLAFRSQVGGKRVCVLEMVMTARG